MRGFPIGTAFLSLSFLTPLGRTTFAILILLAFVSRPLAGQEVPVGARDGEHRILFRTHNGAVYVPARVNGSKTTLLIDTGATLSTFNMKIVSATRSDARMTMNVATGSVPAFLVSAGFILGDSDIKEERCWFRRTVVTGDFKFGEADGVIGIDVLSSFKAVTFDFQHSVLILEDR
jgi:Aspartyl protease